jgi:DNA-binding XRE family transcriptional regulator
MKSCKNFHAHVKRKLKRERLNLSRPHMTLKDMSQARALTQERMAELLKIRQDSISKLEKRTDLPKIWV